MSIVPPEDGDGHDHVEQSSIGIDDKRRSAVLILHPAHQADVHIGIRPQLRHDDLRIKASPIRSLLGARAQSDEHALGAGRMVDGDADLILAEPQIGDRCRCWRPTRFHCPPPDRATRCEARPRTLPSRRGRSRGPTAAIATASTGPVARSRAIGPRQLRSESSEWSRTRLIAIPIGNPQPTVTPPCQRRADDASSGERQREVRIPSVQVIRRIVTEPIEPQGVAFLGSLPGAGDQAGGRHPTGHRSSHHLPIIHHHSRVAPRERYSHRGKKSSGQHLYWPGRRPTSYHRCTRDGSAPRCLPDSASPPDRTRTTPARRAPRQWARSGTRARTRGGRAKAGPSEGHGLPRGERDRDADAPQKHGGDQQDPQTSHVQPISLSSGVGPGRRGALLDRPVGCARCRTQLSA